MTQGAELPSSGGWHLFSMALAAPSHIISAWKVFGPIFGLLSDAGLLCSCGNGLAPSEELYVDGLY